jgi:hypothetical protein
MLTRLEVSRIWVRPVSFVSFFSPFNFFSFKLLDTAPSHTYTSSHSCACCCRGWTSLSEWYPNSNDLFFSCQHSLLIFVEREKCGLVMLIPSLQKIHPRLLWRFDATCCRDDKRFLCDCSSLSRRISWVLPSAMLQLFLTLNKSISSLPVSRFFFHGMLFPLGNSYFQIWETLFMVVTWCHALIFVSKQVDSV